MDNTLRVGDPDLIERAARDLVKQTHARLEDLAGMGPEPTPRRAALLQDLDLVVETLGLYRRYYRNQGQENELTADLFKAHNAATSLLFNIPPTPEVV